MANLDVNVKRFIVVHLACHDTPSQVVRAVKDEFGLEISRMQAHRYDPTRSAGKDVSKELRALFFETREKFDKAADEIPIAKKAYRLRALQKMFEFAESRQNLPLAAQLLEQAAKESGGGYTNTRVLTTPDGTPFQVNGTLNVRALSDTELDQAIRGDFSAIDGA
jgi:hypothetical protein